jgi:hypothetical protein
VSVRELVFALEFRGTAGPVPGGDGRREARTTATSQTLSTVLSTDGVLGGVEAGSGETAVLEARVQRFGDGTFLEHGSICYGGAGSITFETVGRGWVEAGGEGSTVGAVLWRVTGGEGRFAGARGFITSNFRVSGSGEVVDDQFARIFVG